MKTCTRCKETKDYLLFAKDKRRKDGYACHCKSCMGFYSSKVSKETRNKNSIQWKEVNPQKVRKQWLKQTYNISWEEYETLFNSQQGRCAICNKQLKLHKGIAGEQEVACVDHCHESLLIRGLLCSNCNSALGLLNEDSSIVQRAVKYLQKENGVMTKEEYMKEVKAMRGAN